MSRLLIMSLAAFLFGCASTSTREQIAKLGERAPAIDEEARRSRLELACDLATEGIVLLKNDDRALPLVRTPLVVFMGITSYHPHRMGWGSGDMLAHEPVSYDRGFERYGRLEPKTTAFYRNVLAKRMKKGVYDRVNRDWDKWTLRFEEPDLSAADYDKLLEGVDSRYACVVTIGRNAGENRDLEDKPGSFRLHPEERTLLDAACRHFDTVVVLLNTCGVIDTSFLDEYPVKGLVHTSLLGQTSGDAVARILVGRVSPSGKTVDTWAKGYRDYPTGSRYGTLEVPYDEGSFVGYRHFDAASVEPRYPFGFGLSYTTFSVRPGTVVRKGNAIRLPVTVGNTGSCRGKEVVQVYFSNAARDPASEPVKSLVAFAKTKELAPGEVQTLDLAFDLSAAAVYDETSSSWILPEGDLRLFVGTSSRPCDLTAVRLGRYRRTVLAKAPTRLGEGLAPAHVPARPLAVSPYDMTLTLQDVLMGMATVEQLVAQMSDEDLVSIVNGRIMGRGLSFLGGTGVGGVKKGRVDCEAGEFWSSDTYGIPALTCADGPSGVRLANFSDPVSAYNPIAPKLVSWPCGTALAQSWNVSAAEAFGRAIAEEMALADIDGWLAPGVNIHRNPLCGRNFEYFSEDPLVAGRFGAAIVRGVQTKADGTPSGRYATVKHFCTNNQEAHRGEQMNIVSEKALREIYLKPFEIVVREADPLAVMSSYNRLNGEFCAANEALLTGVLRNEWGFEGIVMTDWWTSSDKRLHPAAGNDVIMPGVARDYDDLLAALRKGSVARGDLQQSAVRILKVVLNRMSASASKK